MRIAFFGPPGAGKGTQAELVEHRFGFQSISTGVLIRAAISDATALGRQARSYVEDGRLVPDGLVRQLAVNAIAECGYDGFILDGYPRTLAQALELDAFLSHHAAPLDAVISLRVPEQELVERLSGRRIHRRTGATYHLAYHPPPPDLDADLLVQRADDCPAAIGRRLAEYRSVTAPVLDHFAERGILVTVSGSGSVHTVSRRLLAVLENLAVPA